jgi:hypothetical protein
MSKTIFAADDQVTVRTYKNEAGENVNPSYCGEYGHSVIRTGKVTDTSDGSATVHFEGDETPTDGILFRRMRLAVAGTPRERAAQHIEQLARKQERDLARLHAPVREEDADDEPDDTSPDASDAEAREALIDALRAGAAYLLSA